MATRLYFRNVTSAGAPSAHTDNSTALPTGTEVTAGEVAGQADLSMLTTQGAAQTSKAVSSSNITTEQSGMIVRFTSEALAAQTINAPSAGSPWTFACGSSYANANANSFYALSIYAFRPPATVVGMVYDASTQLGTEWTTAADGQVISLTSGGTNGANRTILDNDRLVIEVWYRELTQAMGTAYAQNIFFDGATDVTGASTADMASYIETPQDLAFPATPSLLYAQPPEVQRILIRR